MSSSAGPVIVLEFNELTPSLMDRFIEAGRLPHFKQIRDESRVFVTEARETAPTLEPWIQWVTVHNGQPYRDHRVFHLDEGHKADAPRVWDVLAEHGLRSWVCGSMNASVKDRSRTLLLTDPWTSEVASDPALDAYVSFVRYQVLEHTNADARPGASMAARFAAFMTTHGLSIESIVDLARQLAAERRQDCRWRRATLLDRLQFDLFVHYYRRIRPAFSTFFLNSTAHYQHAYWASMDPASFGERVEDPETRQHGAAILYGYTQMDRLLGRLMKLCPDATLVLCTALSQQPGRSYRTDNGGAFYRPKDISQLAELVGLAGPFQVAPVMSEQFHLEFGDEAAAVEAERALSKMRLDGAPVIGVERNGRRVFAGCNRFTEIPERASIDIEGRAVPFFDLFYRMPTAKSGIHHPDGMFWVRMADRVHADGGRVPLTAVAPTLLSLFDVAPPATMRSEPVRLTLDDHHMRKTA